MEVITKFPDRYLDEIGLTEEQKQIIISQINRFNELSEKEINNKEITLDVNGKVILKEGTLIHGIGSFNIDKVDSISKSGIITGQALGIGEDGETFNCADFYRIPSNITMEQFDIEFKERTAKNPFNKSNKNSLAFIIEPTQECEELFSYDCYKIGTKESEITKEFVNVDGLPIEEHSKGASILYGVPQNTFSGIVLGDALFEKKEIITYLNKLFPKCYISSRKGDVIYQPNKNTIGINELTDLRREKYLLTTQNENLIKENNDKDNKFMKQKEDYNNLFESIIKTCSVEEIAQILASSGWQKGNLDACMQAAMVHKERYTKDTENKIL